MIYFKQKDQMEKKYNLIFIFRVENIPDEEEREEKLAQLGRSNISTSDQLSQLFPLSPPK